MTTVAGLFMPRWIRSHVNTNLCFVSVQRFQRSSVLFHEIFARDINQHLRYDTGHQLATAPPLSRTCSNGAHPEQSTMMALNARRRADKSKTLDQKAVCYDSRSHAHAIHCQGLTYTNQAIALLPQFFVLRKYEILKISVCKR
jgi:hypothetical protein